MRNIPIVVHFSCRQWSLQTSQIFHCSTLSFLFLLVSFQFQPFFRNFYTFFFPDLLWENIKRGWAFVSIDLHFSSIVERQPKKNNIILISFLKFLEKPRKLWRKKISSRNKDEKKKWRDKSKQVKWQTLKALNLKWMKLKGDEKSNLRQK